MNNHVLLLDDNRATNFIHKKFLTDYRKSLNVITFQRGDEALNYLGDPKNIFPDILFIDINMPSMDAWEFLDDYKELTRQEKNRASIYILTTSSSPSDTEKFQSYQLPRDMLYKPLDSTKIKVVFEELAA